MEDDFDAAGDATLEVISCINHEAVIEGRRRVIARYRESVDKILNGESGQGKSASSLFREVREDDFGIADWFAFYEGSLEESFRQIRNLHPAIWQRFAKAALKSHYSTLGDPK